MKHMAEIFQQSPLSPDDLSAQAIDPTDQQLALLEADYVTEVLQKTEVQDLDAIPHPVYTVAGRRVAFRNRNELAAFEQPWAAIALESSPPLNVGGNEQVSAARWREYGEKAADPAAAELMIVSVTPQGLMAAAEQFGSSNAEALRASRQAIQNGEYDETALGVIDGMLAGLVIDDAGNMRNKYDTDGYALVLAGLTGDEVAAALIRNKVAALYAYKAAEASTDVAELRRHIEENAALYPESIKPQHIALVHSTEHELSHDATGTLVLKAASQHRDDQLPRATLHFTVNGQVTSHLGGQWSDKNKLIVTNLQNILDADGLPQCMNAVDTYYALDPGQSLRLPGAKVIESRTDQTELVAADGDHVTYKDRQAYSDQEKAEITALARRYRVRTDEYNGDYSTLLREVTLRQTLESVGVETFVIAGPHYSDNDQFDKAYTRLASELGVGNNGLHASSGNSSIEDYSTIAMVSGDYTGWDERGNGSDLVVTNASLPAMRQVVASGYIPARPLARKSPSGDEAFLGF